MIRPSTSVPGDITVREGRDRYLTANGFSTETYTHPTVEIAIFGRPTKFPNPPARQRAVPLHDLHHVATGYGTDFIGEAEIGIWELVAGCNTFILWFLNGSATLIGLVLSPRRIWRAGLRAQGAKSLYVRPLDYEVALTMNVAELRAHLGIPPEGQADEPACLHDQAPGWPDNSAPSSIK